MLRPIVLFGQTSEERARVVGVSERTLDRKADCFDAEGFAGLPDRSHAPKAPKRKVDFKAMAAIRRVQANPDLGEFRVHAALAQMGIHLSPRPCGRIMARNRALGLPRPADAAPHDPKPMPFAATYRHEYWSVDVSYVETHGLADPKPVYVISVLENDSRALLADVLSPRQDLTAYLLVLRAALHEYGAPAALVSDSGSIFRANQAKAIYRAYMDYCSWDRFTPDGSWGRYTSADASVATAEAGRQFLTSFVCRDWKGGSGVLDETGRA